jgi:hypothetical protein
LAVKALTVGSGVKTMTGDLIVICLKEMANQFGLATALWAVGVDLSCDICHQTGARQGLVNELAR